ncbi:MAG: hypothetical protein FWF30_00335, partial [Coriobacteriia bacterium]|nr:hypothetical protein [Coriobacteriia bacterium]
AYATPASAAAYATPASAAAYAGASAYATPAPASAAATSAGQYNRQSVAVQPERTYPEAEPRPRLREVPGTRPARKAALPRLGRRILIALAAAGLIFVATGISCAALSSSTSHTMKANDTLQQNINEAYSIANSNAARYAALINPDNIQRQASDLGMAVDPDPEVLELGASQ